MGFLLLSPFIITWGINTPFIKHKISYFIYQKTGNRIDDSKFFLAIFPHPSLLIKKFILTPDNDITVSIDFIKFNFNIQQLLQGNIAIDQITVDRPELKPILTQGKTVSSPLNISISRYIQELKNILAFLPEHQTSVELRIKNAITQYFEQMDGSVFLSKEKEEIILNTTIKKLKFRQDFISNTAFENYPDLDSIELGRADFFASINGKGELQGRCTLLAATLLSKNKKKLLDSNRIESSFKMAGDMVQIVIPPFTLNNPEASIGIHFEKNPLGEKTRLEFTGTNINVDPARQMSLKIFKDNTLVKNIFQIIRTGFVPDIQVSFQGHDLKDLFGADQFRLKGNIEKGSVAIPKTDLVATDVNADVHIQHGILDIVAKRAVIQNSTVDKGHLSIDLLNDKTIPFQGEFSLDLDLSQIGKTLISLLPNTLLAKELSLVHDVTGRSNAELGLLLEPGSPGLKVRVDAPNLSASGGYDRIPGNIRLENVNFKYEPDWISLNHLNASINGNKIYDMDARINFQDDALINIQSGSASIDLESIMPVLMSYKKTRDTISPVKIGTGKIHITRLALEGPILKPELWKYELDGKTDGLSLSSQQNQPQIEGLSCQYHLSRSLFNMKHIQAKIHHLSWIESFIDKKHLDSILMPFDLENGNFQMGAKNSFFQTNLKFPSGPTIHIDLKGETLASFFLNTIKISDKTQSNASASFNTNKDKPFVDFKGMFNTTSLNKVIRPDSFWGKKIDAFTQGQPILIQEDKDSNLQIITQTIDLNSFFPQPDSISTKRRLLPDKTIHFKSDQLKIQKMTFSHIDSLITLDGDSSRIRLNNAFLCDLEMSGYINLEKDSVSIDIPFKTKNKDNIQELITCLFNRTDYMDGQYSLTGNLKSGNGNGKTDLINAVNGALTLNAEKGRIYKLTLLSRILSVLNVSKFFKGKIPDVTQNGFAYNKIFLEAQIKDSIIHLTRAVIDGQDMTLIFSGWIDPVKETLDLTCLVAPFKTIDLIIEKIPIINTLLNGRLVSVPVKASGQLFDPMVVPLHPSAVGEGLITMMSDILKTPVKLWDKIYGE